MVNTSGDCSPRSAKSRAHTTWSEPEKTLFISGIVDQHLDFSSFNIACDAFKIDFSGLKRVSSYGLENLCSFLRKLHLAQIEFIKCPPALLTHLAVIAELLPFNVTVTSYSAFFICTKCSNQDHILFHLQKDDFSTTRPCSKCGNTAELDHDNEEFLGFLDRIRQRS